MSDRLDPANLRHELLAGTGVYHGQHKSGPTHRPCKSWGRQAVRSSRFPTRRPCAGSSIEHQLTMDVRTIKAHRTKQDTQSLINSSDSLWSRAMNQSGYELLAGEYYRSAHITSRNFDTATSANSRKFRRFVPPTGNILELGSGKGRVCGYLGVEGSRVIQLDSSANMLRLAPREASWCRVRADAMRLPFSSSSFTLVAAFLYDPYNKPEMYEEVQRVLMPGGVFVGTIPHSEWGKSLRSLRGARPDRAMFLMRDGSVVRVESNLLCDSELEHRASAAGLQVQLISHFTLPTRVRKISRDIVEPARSLHRSPHHLPIVTAVVLRKPA